jgi:Zn-dependent protease
MAPTRQGSFRLFQFSGVQVYLHWSWFLVAAYEITSRQRSYSTPLWNGLEYGALFTIVLLHEFGHALACRQVGGRANEIVLWPLGGVAYVAPPPRPGATLWSIAAGPLVNLALAPVLVGLWLIGQSQGWNRIMPDVFSLIGAVCVINFGLLVFNLLPIYPLDGGQILRSLLWFVLGRARSLMVAAVIGLVGGAVLIGLVLFWLPPPWLRSPWLILMCVFILMNCWQGLMQARLLTRAAQLPRHEAFACPACHVAPVRLPIWRCGRCGKAFDTFETQAVCPHCGTQWEVTQCLECGESRPIQEWATAQPAPPRLPEQTA